MLSRQLLSRGITSIRPSRLSIPTLRRNFHIQQHLLTKLPGKTRGRPKKQSRDGERPPTSAPGTPFALDIARARAERKFLLGSRLKAALDKSEEDKIQRRKDTERLVIEEDRAETMEKPEGISQEEFDGMTLAERIQLRWDLRNTRMTHKQSRNNPADRAEWEARIKKYEAEHRRLREKVAADQAADAADFANERRKKAGEEISPMDCPDGISPEDWALALARIEKRKQEEELKRLIRANRGIGALLVDEDGNKIETPQAKKEPRKKKVLADLTPEEIEFNIAKAKAQRVRWLKKKKVAKIARPEGVSPEDFDKMSIEEKYDLFDKLALLPKPIRIRKNVGHTKMDITGLVSARTKVKSIATKTVQFKAEIFNALKEAGIVGSDLDFHDGSGAGVFASADTSRMNIMSKELCDDVLVRLGPSLEKHKGCDIIDINPGVGLWSSKLHDHLKPRNHILMEPDGIYASHLAKYVEQDPTYKHLPLSGIIWKNLLKIEEDNLLPDQTRRHLGDPELDKPNDTLLVTVNLGYYPRRSYLGFASLTHLVMNQLFTASRAHSVFQAYGQIRMLVWVHDYEKRIIVPRTVNLRKKSAIEAETCSEYIREICGADGANESSQRSKNVNLISARRVRARMEAAGISNPAHRMSRLEIEMREAMDEGIEQNDSLTTSWKADLEMLEKGLVEKHFPMYLDANGKSMYVEDAASLSAAKIPRLPPGGEPSAAWAKYTQLRHRNTSDVNQERQIQNMTTDYEELEAKYLAITKMDMEQETKERQLQIVEQQIHAWVEKLENQIELRRRRITQNVMENKGINIETPVLEWDRRAYEPMVTHPKEFWPRQEMALLDIQPKTLWPSLTKNGLGDYDYYDLLLSFFCHYPNKSIVERLQAFAPGADEWIIPRCPSLRDVTKGGCVDLTMMTVRNMTQEHLRDVFEGFMNWPFRPGKGRLLQMLGSTSVHEEEREEEGGGNGKGW